MPRHVQLHHVLYMTLIEVVSMQTCYFDFHFESVYLKDLHLQNYMLEREKQKKGYEEKQ